MRILPILFNADMVRALLDNRKTVTRRRAKDPMGVLAPILAWAEGNRPVIKSLERLLGEVRKAEKNTENRIYTPRTKR